MDGKIDAVRRGLEIADAFCGEHTADECPDTVAIPIKSALAALPAIDTEAIRREARAEALGDAVKAIGMMNQMAATAMNDDYLIGYGFGVRDCQIRLESILSAEPAQDDGKAEICESSGGFVEPNSRDMQIADKVRMCTLGVGAAIVVAKYRVEIKRRIEEAKE